MIFVFTIGSLYWSSQHPINRDTGYSNVLWSHHTGNTCKILWIQDLNFMLVYNMNYQLIFPFWYEVTCFTTEMWTYRLYSLFEMKSPHWKHLHDTLDTEFTFDMNSQVFNSIIVFAIAWFVTFLLMPLNFGRRQHWSGHKHFWYFDVSV